MNPQQEKEEAAPAATVTASKSQERNHSMSSMTDTHPDVARVFSEIDNCPDGHFITLTEGDPFYAPVTDDWVRLASSFRARWTPEVIREDIENGHEHAFGEWYAPDGRLIPVAERDDEWMEAEWDGMPGHIPTTPNAVWRSPGGYLYVSRGAWVPVSETTVDGEVAFRFLKRVDTFEEYRAAARRIQQEWLDAHPEVERMRPAWATKTFVFFDEEPLITIRHEAKFGSVILELSAQWFDGHIKTADQAEFYMENNDGEATAADLLGMAADFTAAADALDIPVLRQPEVVR